METVLLSSGNGIFATKFINILVTNHKTDVQMKGVNTNPLAKQKMVLCPRIK